ncbi:hypothetical protein ACOSP6_06065 [Tenacibaculum sp. MEBiC06402]|uniref:hypothetical protein n=1 Tax=unclassified Tenacibaculum TaxID=2635139 RepID=UPI003B9D86BA
MKRNKSSKVIHLKTSRNNKIVKTTNTLSFILIFSFFISLSLKNELLFLSEMLLAAGIILMTLISNLLSVKQ